MSSQVVPLLGLPNCQLTPLNGVQIRLALVRPLTSTLPNTLTSIGVNMMAWQVYAFSHPFRCDNGVFYAGLMVSIWDADCEGRAGGCPCAGDGLHLPVFFSEGSQPCRRGRDLAAEGTRCHQVSTAAKSFRHCSELCPAAQLTREARSNPIRMG